MFLDNLPAELLPNIFDHLPADELWLNLRAVSRRLNRLLREPRYWLKRAERLYGLALPDRLRTSPGDDQQQQPSSLLPIRRCIATELEARRCSRRPALPAVVGFAKVEAHFGTIDALRLFRASGQAQDELFCLTGARDRQIKLWPLGGRVEEGEWPSTTIDKAHEGWIWSISRAEDSRHFYSASWDSSVKQWELGEQGITQVLQIPLTEAALCCVAEGPHLLYVSTYRCGPMLFDVRAGPQAQAVQKCHGQKSVIELATGPDTHRLFSIGDDCQLAAVDKRQFQGRPASSFHASSSISHLDYAEGQLCLSLRNGRLLFFQPESLELENELAIAGPNPLQGHQNIRLTRGGTFCTSSDGHLRLFTPGLRPRQVGSSRLPYSAVTRLDVLGGHIVAAIDMGWLHHWHADGHWATDAEEGECGGDGNWEQIARLN